MEIHLKQFSNDWYDPGRKVLTRILWYFVNALFLINPLNPSSRVKIYFLRIFGCKIGEGVVLKPRINIKYPWKVEIGDYSWIGEGVWLDSLAAIKIGSNVCVSQGAYFCTGNHNWEDPTFCLIVKPILVEEGAWIGARATILPGVIISSHSVISAGTTISKSTKPYRIYAHASAVSVKVRVICEKSGEPN